MNTLRLSAFFKFLILGLYAILICNHTLLGKSINVNSEDHKSSKEETKVAEKLLGTYYFGAGYFTLVPDNIRKDLDEIKQLGTDFVCITATVSDLRHTKPNIDFIVDEIHKRGMKVFLVPSRLAGITAGQPLEPPIFPYHHLNTWVIKKDGKPLVRKGLGPISSFYYPEVKEYFISSVHKMMDTWEIDGIVWDEPKSTFIGWQDFSAKAIENNPDSSYVKYMEDFANFFSEVNKSLKEKDPKLTILFFDEACRNDVVPEKTATIKYLDYFGTDGRPYFSEDSPEEGNRGTKVIPKYGERFISEGRKNGLKTFVLIENQKITGEEIKATDKAFPYILNMDLDMMIYYYYGRYKADTEEGMNVIRKHIANFKK